MYCFEGYARARSMATLMHQKKIRVDFIELMNSFNSHKGELSISKRKTNGQIIGNFDFKSDLCTNKMVEGSFYISNLVSQPLPFFHHKAQICLICIIRQILLLNGVAVFCICQDRARMCLSLPQLIHFAFGGTSVGAN
jgi:hypothetical protein